jgi:subtilisin family serine protease
MKKLWMILCCHCLTFSAFAENLIVKFKNAESLQQGLIETSDFSEQEVLVADLNLALVSVPEFFAPESIENLLTELRANPAVVYAQKDHVLSPRTESTKRAEPNDPKFSDLWNFKASRDGFTSSNAVAAWDQFGTGGASSNGSWPVAAVVDFGFEPKHEDLKDNMWVNTNEIAGNNLDDDQNGFIDDIHGWNAYNKNGNISGGSSHGSHVAGIIGARGNNSIGVTGINWETKILVVKIGTAETSEILRAYGYLLKQKNLWISTKGQQGANIVSANSSFGVDKANCNNGEFPAWNDIYKEMGAIGILNAAATANAGWDIDAVGDVPTGCSADHIVAVTRVGQTGLFSGAGYGLKTIDIGAPGSNVLSTVPGSYGVMSGTSMSTPHITGAIAYLYSVASDDFLDFAEQNPGEAALKVKEILLASGKKHISLDKKSVSGAVLDLHKAAEMISQYTR